jgi:hypothetical protein
MKALMQDYYMNSTYGVGSTVSGALFYMSGTAPTTVAGVKALVDLSNMSDLHSKCVGCSYISGTITQGSDGVFVTDYTQYAAGYSWVKGGYMATTSGTQYYILPPSRVYYEYGRKSTGLSMPPFVFAMPYACVSNALPATNNQAAFQFRDAGDSATYSFAQAGSEIVFDLEYDTATTISAFRIASGPSVSGNNYVAGVYVFAWVSGAWSIISPAPNNGQLSAPAMNTITFTATTNTKFRIVLYPYSLSGGYNMLNNYGICLMHTSPPASTALASSITWGVIVDMPRPDGTSKFWPFRSELMASVDPSKVDDPSLANLLESPASLYLGSKVINNVPAIIDSCSNNARSSKIYISKSTSLTTLDHPVLGTYRYKAGDLT